MGATWLSSADHTSAAIGWKRNEILIHLMLLHTAFYWIVLRPWFSQQNLFCIQISLEDLRLPTVIVSLLQKRISFSQHLNVTSCTCNLVVHVPGGIWKGSTILNRFSLICSGICALLRIKVSSKLVCVNLKNITKHSLLHIYRNIVSLWKLYMVLSCPAIYPWQAWAGEEQQ